ncbi:hypothetical protein ACOSQ3_016533 [Xanthoceras sorbifolium]
MKKEVVIAGLSSFSNRVRLPLEDDRTAWHSEEESNSRRNVGTKKERRSTTATIGDLGFEVEKAKCGGVG